MDHLIRVANCYINMDSVAQIFISKDELPNDAEPWIVLEFNNGSTSEFTGVARARLINWLFLNATEA